MQLSRRRLIYVAIAILLTATGFKGVEWMLFNYVNSISDPVNSNAKYPKESFQHLDLEKMGSEGSKVESMMDQKTGKIKGNRMSKRLLIAGIGLYDATKTSDKVLEVLHRLNGSGEQYGQTSALCPKSGFRGVNKCRHDNRYSNIYTSQTIKFVHHLHAIGVLEEFYSNQTAVLTLTNYTRRAEYYDAYLDPQGFGLKPIEAAFYTGSGLHIIGEHEGNLRLDGEKLSVEKKSHWAYSNITLSTGKHRISSGNYSIPILIHGYLPYWGFKQKEVIVAGSGNNSQFFDQITVRGEDWNNSEKLDKNKTRIELPERAIYTGKDEETKHTPFSLEFEKDNLSLEYKFYNDGPENNSYRPFINQVFGMTDTELENFMNIAGYIDFYSKSDSKFAEKIF